MAALSPTCSCCCCYVSEQQPIFLPSSPWARGLPVATPLWPAWDSSRYTRRERHTTELLCVCFAKLPQKSKNHILHEVSGPCCRQCGSMTSVPRMETRSSASLYGKIERDRKTETHTERGRDREQRERKRQKRDGKKRETDRQRVTDRQRETDRQETTREREHAFLSTEHLCGFREQAR